MKLTKNFSLSEFTRSNTANKYNIDNSPTQEHLMSIQALTSVVLQKIREEYGSVTITSGYRSKVLNATIKGSSTSQHTKGEAADIVVGDEDLYGVAEWIRDNLEFDQMILEVNSKGSRWIHCSYTRTGDNRKEVLTAHWSSVEGKMVYEYGLHRRDPI